jgi:hypothetical protein
MLLIENSSVKGRGCPACTSQLRTGIDFRQSQILDPQELALELFRRKSWKKV